MDDFRTSRLLKALCYIMIPILVIIIGINAVSIGILVENQQEIESSKEYFQTENFKQQYMYMIGSTCSYLERRIRTEEKSNVQIADEEQETDAQIQVIIKETAGEEKQSEKIDYNKITNYIGAGNTYEILIIRQGVAYTNVEKTTKTDEIEKIKQYIMEKPYHWSYDLNEVKTDFSKMQYEEIAYNSYFEDIKEKGYEVYSCIKNPKAGRFQIEQIVFQVVAKTYETAPVTVLFSSILLITAIVYLIASIGHKKGYKGVYTDSLDKVPLELLAIALGGILTLEGFMIAGGVMLITGAFWAGVSLAILMGLIMYVTLAIGMITFIRRVKARVFLKNTLCYELYQYIKRKSRRVKELVLGNLSLNVKIILAIASVVILSMFLWTVAEYSFFFFIILMIFWYFVLKIAIVNVNKLYKLRQKIAQLYKGEVKEDLDTTQFAGEMKQVAEELNDISGGLSHAIEDVLKSERLKTELITNVSHDIKTPLTSIINYVDLLKKEDIQNETAREYLQILDNKSQRLKKLTEDLVEASKASSGNIKLNIERLNLSELLKQVRGEFEDKFQERGLEIIETLPEKELYIKADSKYLYRVIENLYTNIAKYALEHSRVYVDLIQSGVGEAKTATIILKNISAEKLNISAEELMQRFVRGDSARTTSGSGLGLSIAQSLTELQKGKFELQLDGDLFKVIIEFPH